MPEDATIALLSKHFPLWSKYIPHLPTGKQLAFLLLPHEEALFGGAAGGGKSDALLMAALQYVHIPNYSAIIFRKTYSDLKLPGALIDRSMLWLKNTDARWIPQEHCWLFPTGAKVAFGYLDSEMVKYRYQGAEFHLVAFDELTQFLEEDFEYLFSRLRRTVDFPVPLRMRSATNPGGRGHVWVKKRYQIQKVGNIYRGTDPNRPHIPAFLSDNPFLEQDEYQRQLEKLDPVTREQLLRGDWGVSADGRFRKAWAKYFTQTGDFMVLGPSYTSETRAYRRNRCRCFITVDPAASIKEGPSDLWANRAASHTVISTWLVTPDHDLLWWDMWRFKKEIPDILIELKRAQRLHEPEYIGVEANGLGIGVYQMAMRSGLPVKDLRPRSLDKLVRATDACNRMAKGKIWFPQDQVGGGQEKWLEDAETELFTWTGDPREEADIIDTLAYAAMEISSQAGYEDGLIIHSHDLPGFVSKQPLR